jgi:rhodanese-related sulfurtransferase
VRLAGARLVGAVVDVAIVAGTLAIVVWWQHGATPAASQRTTAAEMGFRIGERAVIAGVDWGQAERTVFLVVTTNCPACNASVAYYRTLFDACASGTGCRDLVLSLEPAEAVHAWLRRNRIGAQHVATVTMSAAPGLHTTPTVAIVDSRGIITDLDVGLLRPAQEARFLARVMRQPGGAVAAPERQPMVIDLDRRLPMTMRQFNVHLLDVREREACAKDRHRDAVCFPLQELAARAPAEFDRNAAIIVDCSRVARTPCLRATERLMLNGFSRVSAAVVPTAAESAEKR